SGYLFHNVEAVEDTYFNHTCRHANLADLSAILDALEANPEFRRRPDELAYPWYLRGRLRLEQGDAAGAVRWFAQSFASGPRFEMGMQMVAQLATRKRDRDALILLEQ